MVEAARDDRPVAQNGGLLPQAEAPSALTMIAGGGVRPFKSFAILDITTSQVLYSQP